MASYSPLTPEVKGEPTGSGVAWLLTCFFNGIFFILKEHAVREVHGSLESALLAEELEELGRAELVPPLVGSGAEAQTQGKEETLQAPPGPRGLQEPVYPPVQPPTLHFYSGCPHSL